MNIFTYILSLTYFPKKGPTGPVKDERGVSESHGFCLLNNISIAASYAMNRYRDFVKKVAIIDFGKLDASLALFFSLEEVVWNMHLHRFYICA